ncbi:MAG: hypothetical protein KGI69_01300 [Patescibacteria group bacterium]|nr:hypothetical protein [Patescibacteria group bacterium]
MKEFLGSSALSKLVAVLAVLLVALVIFWAGMAVGYRKAVFSYQWDDSYAKQFGGPHSPFMPDADDASLNSHGAFGQIVAVRLPEFTVKGPAEAEKNVLVSDGTVIRYFHDQASTSDLSVGSTVVVIGEPDGQGRIQASLIRIVPPPPSASGTPPQSSPLASPINNQ